MFFTKTAKAIAWLMVVLGGSHAVLGFAMAILGDQAMAPRYLGTDTTGEAIDEGLKVLLIGAVVGMLAEISGSIAAIAPQDAEEE
ncbi:hypothetical protein [Rhodovulum visakhapatnamense]|nr:hypothetical protein [Rhodovulum visakhapatnamense]